VNTAFKPLLISLALLSSAACQPTRTVKVTVVGEDGEPIPGAEVLVGFVGYKNDKTEKGPTNEAGVFEATGVADLRMLTRIKKEGYYETVKDRLNRKEDHDLVLTLRKKINPIPLYAKRWEIITKNFNKKLGFDFEVGDWVGPYGQGKKTDIYFEISYTSKDIWNFDYRLEVSFPNEEDGIQPFETVKYSELRSPYQAPLGGYERKWLYLASRNGKKAPSKNNGVLGRNYWMRIRSRADDDGNLISAHYVKIYGEFPDLHYYFNPRRNDRNLEFDPGKNLFIGLNSMERQVLP